MCPQPGAAPVLRPGHVQKPTAECRGQAGASSRGRGGSSALSWGPRLRGWPWPLGVSAPSRGHPRLRQRLDKVQAARSAPRGQGARLRDNRFGVTLGQRATEEGSLPLHSRGQLMEDKQVGPAGSPGRSLLQRGNGRPLRSPGLPSRRVKERQRTPSPGGAASSPHQSGRPRAPVLRPEWERVGQSPPRPPVPHTVQPRPTLAHAE